ncbi:hypothetical protein AQI84_34570 [Streptomyces griseorubiginosus]|nr:hypothetical protein AQI84_34570 [Streptomyces griseorubiginosus]
MLGVKSPISASRVLREWGVINQSRSGTSNSYLAEDVVKVAFDRRRVALARHRDDPAAYAREIVAQLRPPAPPTVTLVDGRKVPRDSGADLARAGADRNPDPLVMIGPDAAMIFGPGVLKAAAADLKPGTCRYCVAHIETPWGGIGPDLSEACRTLLGQPCLRCTVDLTPAKRPAARTASARPRTAQTAVSRSGPTPMVWWSSQAANARALAAQARRRGEQGEAAQLEQRATVYDTRARRGDPIG